MFSAHRSEFCLSYKPSLVAAASVLLALNVSVSQTISRVIGINLLQLEFDRQTPGPLGWIDDEFEMATGVEAASVKPVY